MCTGRGSCWAGGIRCERRISIPSFRILQIKVVRGDPSSAAAPCGPPTTPSVCCVPEFQADGCLVICFKSIRGRRRSESVEKTTARSMTFCNSRTLPGQSCRLSTFIISKGIASMGFVHTRGQFHYEVFHGRNSSLVTAKAQSHFWSSTSEWQMIDVLVRATAGTPSREKLSTGHISSLGRAPAPRISSSGSPSTAFSAG